MSYYNPANAQLGFAPYNSIPVNQRQPVNIGGIPQQLSTTQHGDLSVPNSSSTNNSHHAHHATGARGHDERRTPGLPPDNSVGIDSSGPELTPAAAKERRKERKNRPGQKFGAKKKSWVWTWFVQDTQDPNVAACDYCGKIITRLSSDKGSPKKLTEHLKTHKLTRDSINNARSIPIDGNGVTYTPNGMPLTYDANHPSASSHPGHLQIDQASRGHFDQSLSQLAPVHQEPGPMAMAAKEKRGYIDNRANSLTPVQNPGFGNRRYVSAEFDNSPYSAMKFHKHLMKFVTENKLSINVIKSHSFQQLVYDLRSDSVAELLDLTNFYSSLLEVSRIDNNSAEAENNAGPGSAEVTVANSLAQAVEQKVAAATAAGRQ